MKTAGTHVPARRSAGIVFGAPNGQKSPSAGFFAHKDSPMPPNGARVGYRRPPVIRSTDRK